MKRRLLSLLLCISLLVPAAMMLVSCGEKGNVSGPEATKPMTVTLTMIKEEGTTDAAIALVEDALNNITESNYNTHVVLQLFERDEYEERVSALIEARQKDDEEGITKSSIGSADMIKLNEYGRQITVYPEPYENQIDIFMMTSYEMFRYYLDYKKTDEEGNSFTDRKLTDISPFLGESSGMLITKYFGSEVLWYGWDDLHNKKQDEVYGIGNNGAPTNYEYLLVNKELFDKGRYDFITSTEKYGAEGIAVFEDYLVELAKEGITPLANITDLGIYSLTGKDTVVGQHIAKSILEPLDAYLPVNILTVPTVRSALTVFHNIQEAGGAFPAHTDEVDFTQKFGACFVKGDCTLYEEYNEKGVYTVNGVDYYVLISGEPYVDSHDVTDCMWGISTYTSDAERCMQILTLLNTNEQFRNIVLYGIENATYYIDEENGLVNRYANPKTDVTYYTKSGKPAFNADGSLACDLRVDPKNTWDNGDPYTVACAYNMDMYQTGNVMLAWPNADMSEDELNLAANKWAKAKKALADGYYSPYIGFNLVYNEPVDETTILMSDIVDDLELLYDEMLLRAKNYTPYVDPTTGKVVEFEQYLNVMQDWLANEPSVKRATATEFSAFDYSLRRQYQKYYEAYKLSLVF